VKLRFGEFQLDTAERVLRKGDVEVALEPKVFDCLALLLREPGRLCSMELLRGALWPDVRVGDGALRRVINDARKALGDSGDVQAVIRTRKGLGYCFVQPVVADSASAPPGHAAVPDWPFVGRARELDTLRDWVASGQGGGLCLISGEAGAGKTSLLARFAAQDVEPACWFFGHCQATPGAPPFWPFRELARRLTRDSSLRARVFALASQYPGVQRLLPELASHAAAPIEPRRSEAETSFELCEAFAMLLSSLARSCPLRLAVEDIHWADDGSLAMLDAVARAARDQPLHVFATYRPEAVEAGSPLGRLIGRSTGRAGVLSLQLAPLGIEDLTTLCNELRLPTATQRAAPRLLQLSGGNALYLHELLCHALATTTPLVSPWAASASTQAGSSPVVARSDLDLGSAGERPLVQRLQRTLAPSPPLGAALPSSLNHVVAERAASLPEATQLRLGQAAVLGNEFAIATLAEMAGASLAEISSQLEPALRAALLRGDASHPERLQFNHALIADALLSTLSTHQRQTYHRAALQALRAQPAAEGARAQLALHAFEAGDHVATPERRRLCEQAGRESLAALAFDRAALQLDRALQLTAADDHSVAAAELALSWAQARWHADAPEREIQAAFLHAAERARLAASPALLAEAAIGYAVGDEPALQVSMTALRPKAWELAEEAWQSLSSQAPDLASWPGHIAYRLASALCWMRVAAGGPIGAQRAAQLALSLAPEAPEPRQQLGMLSLRTVAEPERALELAREILWRVQQPAPGLPANQRIEFVAIAMDALLSSGDFAGWELGAGEIARLVELLRLPDRAGARLSNYLGLHMCVPVLRAVVAGQLAEAEAHMLRMIEQAARLELRRTLAGDYGAFHMLLQLYGYLGRSRELEPLFEQALGSDPQAHWFAALFRTQFALEAGERTQADANFSRLRASGFRPLIGETAMLAKPETLLRTADACVEIGTQRDAQQIYDALLPHAHWCIVEGLTCWGSASRPLAALAFQLERYADAERHCADALAMNQRLGHRPELVRTRLGLVRLLRALGRDAEARPLLAAARHEAADMRMTPLIALADRLAAS
jgi:DNA-binding winged helix-turn-helix (wHTH) protein